MNFVDEILSYGDLDSVSSSTSSKILNVYRNGSFASFYPLRVKDRHDLNELEKELKERFKFKHTDKFRLFTVEGVEVYPDDLKYMKNESSLFVSKGESFNKSSMLCEYNIVKKLGEGSFGEVRLAMNKKTLQPVAIKFLKKPTQVDAFGLDRFFSEAETLKQLRHKNIVDVINCFTLKDMQIALVMEYCEGGTLYEYIKSKKRLSEEEARNFFTQIADAISYCHYNKVVHCDLKLENVILKSKESKELKVIDFGIAGLKTHFKSEVDGGTLHYMAPEIVSRKKMSVHSGIDIWAMGCMLYQMLTGKWAFSGKTQKETIERICKGKVSFTEFKNELSADVRDLINKMLEVDVNKRITMYGILSHPWLKPPLRSVENSSMGSSSHKRIEINALNKENLLKQY